MTLDDTDQRLIALLRNDARLPIAKLAAEAGISRATATAHERGPRAADDCAITMRRLR